MGITIEQEHRMHTEKVNNPCPLCPNWTSLKDKLPPENTNVLFTADDGTVEIGRYNPKEGVWNEENSTFDKTAPAITFGGGDWSKEFFAPDWSAHGWDYSDYIPSSDKWELYPLVTITHWMPLPQNPSKVLGLDRKGHGGFCIELSPGDWNCKCGIVDEIIDRISREPK